MTPREVYLALKEQMERAQETGHQWFTALSCRLRDIELRVARIEERENIERRYREPWYRAIVHALVAGLMGAAAAAMALLVGKGE